MKTANKIGKMMKESHEKEISIWKNQMKMVTRYLEKDIALKKEQLYINMNHNENDNYKLKK